MPPLRHAAAHHAFRFAATPRFAASLLERHDAAMPRLRRCRVMLRFASRRLFDAVIPCRLFAPCYAFATCYCYTPPASDA